MFHNKLIALQRAFSSEKLRLPKEQIDESRWVGIALVCIEVRPVLTRVNCSLPFPVASNIPLHQYNSFIESKEISGYKLDYKKGTVYIVEMASTEHEAVGESVGFFFRNLCPGVPSDIAPIQVLGQPRKENSSQFTWSLISYGDLIFIIISKVHETSDGSYRAPDLAVYPHSDFIPDPPVPYPGPPPSDRRVLLICHVFFIILNTNTYMVDNIGKRLCEGNAWSSCYSKFLWLEGQV